LNVRGVRFVAVGRCPSARERSRANARVLGRNCWVLRRPDHLDVLRDIGHGMHRLLSAAVWDEAGCGMTCAATYWSTSPTRRGPGGGRNRRHSLRTPPRWRRRGSVVWQYTGATGGPRMRRSRCTWPLHPARFAFIDRVLYPPRSRTSDPARCGGQGLTVTTGP
jgi:hypothetical protein